MLLDELAHYVYQDQILAKVFAGIKHKWRQI